MDQVGHKERMEPERETAYSLQPIKFRPGKELGVLLEELMAELRVRQPAVELSATLREALLAYFPHLRAYLLARQQANLEGGELVRLTLVAAQAAQHGITAEQIEEALAALLEKKLSA